MLRLIKVTGNSLWPEYREGDFVLIVKIPFLFFHYKVGDVVVFRQPLYGTLIKKIERIQPQDGGLFVVGHHPDSVDSRQFGPILPKATLGKVVWHVRRPLEK
ncbi:MAG: S24 family peptidase [Anaerolineales bacterium]|jgi:nickel-type superoxide dismutase maturation protease